MRRLDLTGKKIGRLTFLYIDRSDKRDGVVWRCRCDCGTEKNMPPSYALRGKTRSCGCLKKERIQQLNYIHGKSHTKTHNIWIGMLNRCTNPNDSIYRHYGLRGITVCDRWLDFTNFVTDMGECPEGMSIERIDNNKGYFPENCRWATRKEQANNTRHNRIIIFNGQTKNLKQWAEKTGLHYKTLYKRLADGWSVERTLTTPIKTCAEILCPII